MKPLNEAEAAPIELLGPVPAKEAMAGGQADRGQGKRWGNGCRA